MPKNPHNQDSLAFSQRLKEAMSDAGLNTGHGAGSALSRRYKASTVTSNAWLNGEHKPEPEKVREMAEDLIVRFAWLYFGELPKRAVDVDFDKPPAALTLTPHEQQLILKYRLAGNALQGLVDAALQGTPAKSAVKSRSAKK